VANLQVQVNLLYGLEDNQRILNKIILYMYLNENNKERWDMSPQKGGGRPRPSAPNLLKRLLVNDTHNSGTNLK